MPYVFDLQPDRPGSGDASAWIAWPVDGRIAIVDANYFVNPVHSGALQKWDCRGAGYTSAIGLQLLGQGSTVTPYGSVTSASDLPTYIDGEPEGINRGFVAYSIYPPAPPPFESEHLPSTGAGFPATLDCGMVVRNSPNPIAGLPPSTKFRWFEVRGTGPTGNVLDVLFIGGPIFTLAYFLFQVNGVASIAGQMGLAGAMQTALDGAGTPSFPGAGAINHYIVFPNKNPLTGDYWKVSELVDGLELRLTINALSGDPVVKTYKPWALDAGTAFLFPTGTSLYPAGAQGGIQVTLIGTELFRTNDASFPIRIFFGDIEIDYANINHVDTTTIKVPAPPAAPGLEIVRALIMYWDGTTEEVIWPNPFVYLGSEVAALTACPGTELTVTISPSAGVSMLDISGFIFRYIDENGDPQEVAPTVTAQTATIVTFRIPNLPVTPASPPIDPPTNLVAFGNPGSGFTYRYVVTAAQAVTFDESWASNLAVLSNVGQATALNPNLLSWSAVPGAVDYFVYADYGEGRFGYAGNSGGALSFSDIGADPDYQYWPDFPVTDGYINIYGLLPWGDEAFFGSFTIPDYCGPFMEGQRGGLLAGGKPGAVNTGFAMDGPRGGLLTGAGTGFPSETVALVGQRGGLLQGGGNGSGPSGQGGGAQMNLTGGGACPDPLDPGTDSGGGTGCAPGDLNGV